MFRRARGSPRHGLPLPAGYGAQDIADKAGINPGPARVEFRLKVEEAHLFFPAADIVLAFQPIMLTVTGLDKFIIGRVNDRP